MRRLPRQILCRLCLWQNSGRQSVQASIRAFSSYLQKYWYFYISLLDISLLRIIISIQYPLIYAIWWALTQITSSPLYEWMKETRGFIYHTHIINARVTLAVTSASAVSLTEDIHEQHLQNCSESHFTSILLFDLSKTSIISYIHTELWRYSRQPVKIKVRLNLKTLRQKYLNIVQQNVHTATARLLLKLLKLYLF